MPCRKLNPLSDVSICLPTRPYSRSLIWSSDFRTKSVAVRRSCVLRAAIGTRACGLLFQIQPERMALGRRFAGTDAFNRADHAAVAIQEAVGDRDDARIRLRRGRGGADRLRDLQFVAPRIDRAGGDE